MKSIICLILFCSSLAFAQTQDEAQTILTKFAQESGTVNRLDLISKSFLDLPYGDGGPLGEGENGRYDQDPLYRFDTFDCTTYIETVIALSISSQVLEFERNLDEIRYEDGLVDYLKRNHFPSLQWVPNNIRNGYLKEINDLVLSPSQQLVAEAVINLPGWLQKIKLEEIRVPLASASERLSLLEELQALSAQYLPVVARLNYLPIATLLASPELLQKIPSGTVINFVRPNWDLRELIGTHMNVSHQGLIFKEKGKVLLRHSSSSGIKKVMENDLWEYLKKFENHPTLKGIHLMQVMR